MVGPSSVPCERFAIGDGPTWSGSGLRKHCLKKERVAKKRLGLEWRHVNQTVGPVLVEQLRQLRAAGGELDAVRRITKPQKLRVGLGVGALESHSVEVSTAKERCSAETKQRSATKRSKYACVAR